MEKDILNTYIDRALRLKSKKGIESRDLEAVALELGLTESDLREIEEAVRQHRLRGSNYLSHNCPEEAVKEFETALALDPVNAPLYCELGEAYHKKFLAKGRKADKLLAEKNLKECIHYDPEYRKAYDLLQLLQKSSPPKSNRTRALVLFGILIMIAASVMAILFQQNKPMPSVDPSEEGPSLVSIETPLQPDSDTTIEEEQESNVKTLPVKLINPPDFLSVEVMQSKLSRYKSSHSYELKADIQVKGIQLDELTYKVSLLNREGKVLYSNFMEAQSEHHPPILPGNTLPANLLVYNKETDPGIVSAEMSVSYIQKNPYTGTDSRSYPAKELLWDIPQPEGVILKAGERANHVTTAFSYSYHNLVFEITNQGPRSLSLLKLRAEWFDEKGDIIEKNDSYVTSGQDSPFQPGQVRLGYFIQNFKDYIPKEANYRLYVIEARTADS